MRLVMNKLNHVAITCCQGVAVFLTLFIASGCSEVRYDTGERFVTVPQRGVQSVAPKYENATASYTVGEGEGSVVTQMPQGGMKSSHGQYDDATAHYTLRSGGNGPQPIVGESRRSSVEHPHFKPIVLDADDIHFEFNKWVIKEPYFAELDRWVEFLQKNRLMNVEIYGHTDNKGSEKYNQQLSEKRAHAIINYLVKKGVAANRLTARGFGERQPVASNSSEKGRSMNRRAGADAKF